MGGQSCWRHSCHLVPPPRPCHLLRPLPRWQAERGSGHADQVEAGAYVKQRGGPTSVCLQTSWRGRQTQPSRHPGGSDDGTAQPVSGHEGQGPGGRIERAGQSLNNLCWDDSLQVAWRHKCKTCTDGSSDELNGNCISSTLESVFLLPLKQFHNLFSTTQSRNA